jgi:hypothetical protein
MESRLTVRTGPLWFSNHDVHWNDIFEPARATAVRAGGMRGSNRHAMLGEATLSTGPVPLVTVF